MDLGFLLPIGYSIGGQLARVALGVIKALKREENIAVKQIFVSLGEAVVVGFLASFVTQDPTLLFTTGFAGTDAVESLVAIASKD